MRKPRGHILALWLLPLSAWADTACEIERLLGFVDRSQCTFFRNGEEYSAADVGDHIQRKYDYAKRWIETTEQFIEYTVTGSSTSGEPHDVICSGRKQPSADWLKQELARLRAGAERAGAG